MILHQVVVLRSFSRLSTVLLIFVVVCSKFPFVRANPKNTRDKGPLRVSGRTIAKVAIHRRASSLSPGLKIWHVAGGVLSTVNSDHCHGQ